MGKTMVNEKGNQEERSLKGTLASVLILGGFIALLWLGIWGLYMMRV